MSENHYDFNEDRAVFPTWRDDNCPGWREASTEPTVLETFTSSVEAKAMSQLAEIQAENTRRAKAFANLRGFSGNPSKYPW